MVAQRVPPKSLHYPYPNIGISSIATKKTWHYWLLTTSSSSTVGCLVHNLLVLVYFWTIPCAHLDCLWYFETQRLGLTGVLKSNHVLQRCKSGDRGYTAIVPHGNIWHIICLRNILERRLVSLARIDLRSSGPGMIHPCWHAHRYRSIDSATRPS